MSTNSSHWLCCFATFSPSGELRRAVEALAAYLPTRARVLRDGQWQETEAQLLVPGDVIEVAEGDKISADATGDRQPRGGPVYPDWRVRAGGTIPRTRRQPPSAPAGHRHCLQRFGVHPGRRPGHGDRDRHADGNRADRGADRTGGTHRKPAGASGQAGNPADRVRRDRHGHRVPTGRLGRGAVPGGRSEFRGRPAGGQCAGGPAAADGHADSGHRPRHRHAARTGPQPRTR
jgi:E1-E2 ATPase